MFAYITGFIGHGLIKISDGGKFNLLVSKGLSFLFSEIDAACSRGFRRGLHIIGSRHFSHNKRDMNPFEFWYATNPGIRNFVNTYYEEHIHLLDGLRSYKRTL